MKQVNLSVGETYEERSRRLILDSSSSSEDDTWNRTAETIALNSFNQQRSDRIVTSALGLRRPASELQLNCCRKSSVGKSCNCRSVENYSKTSHAKLDVLSKQIKELQAKELSLENEIHKSIEQSSEKDCIIQSLRNQLSELIIKKEKAEEKAMSFGENVAILENKIADYQKNSKRVDEMHAGNLNETVKSLEQLQESFDVERKKWQSETKKLAEELESSNKERECLLKRMEELTQQRSSLQKENNSILKDWSDRHERMTQDLAASKEKTVKLEAKVAMLDSLKAEKEELKKQNSALRRQMDATYNQLVENQLRVMNKSPLESSRLPHKPAPGRNSRESIISTSSSISCGNLLAVSSAKDNPHNQQLMARIDSLLAELKLANGKYQIEHEKVLRFEKSAIQADELARQSQHNLSECRKQLSEQKRQNETTLAEFFEVRNKLHSSVEQLSRDTEEIARLEKELKNVERDCSKKSAEIEKLKQVGSTNAGLQARLSESEQVARRLAEECDQRQTKIDQISMQLDSLFDSRHHQRVAYEDQIEAMRLENSRLSDELRAKTEVASNCDMEIRRLEHDLAMMKENVNQTKKSEQILRVEMETGFVNAQSELIGKCQKLESALKEVTGKVQAKEKEKDELEDKLAKDHLKNLELEQMLGNEKAVSEQRNAEVNSLGVALREKEKSLARSQRRINELETNEMRLQQQLTSLGQELANSRSSDERRLCDLEVGNRKLSEQLAQCDRLISEQTAQIACLEAELAESRRNYDAAIEKFADVESKLVDAEAKMTKFQSRQETSESELSRKGAELDGLVNRLDETISELETARRLIVERESRIESLESDLHALVGRAEDADEAGEIAAKTVDELRRLVEQQNDKIECLEVQLNAKDDDLRDVNAELRSRDAEMALRRDQVLDLESGVDAMRSELEGRIEVLEAQLINAQEELCTKITETTRLENELTSSLAELAYFRQSENKVTDEIEAIKADADEKKRLAIGWKKKFDKIDAERLKLETKVAELEAKLVNAFSETNRLKQEIEGQVANVISVKAETDTFKREVANARSEAARLRQELVAKDEQLAGVKTQAAQLSDELEAARKHKAALHNQLVSTAESVKRAKTKLAMKYEHELRDLRLQNSILLNRDPDVSAGAELPLKKSHGYDSVTPDFDASAGTSPFCASTSPQKQLQSLLIADSTSSEADEGAMSTLVDSTIEFSLASHSKLPNEKTHSLNKSATKSSSAWRPPVPPHK